MSISEPARISIHFGLIILSFELHLALPSRYDVYRELLKVAVLSGRYLNAVGTNEHKLNTRVLITLDYANICLYQPVDCKMPLGSDQSKNLSVPLNTPNGFPNRLGQSPSRTKYEFRSQAENLSRISSQPSLEEPEYVYTSPARPYDITTRLKHRQQEKETRKRKRNLLRAGKRGGLAEDMFNIDLVPLPPEFYTSVCLDTARPVWDTLVVYKVSLRALHFNIYF
ncbi:unnamed protein product [Protopolystoma xenopodis]|uniref:Uncharacterized protein n=1 Tax=Protopolystoma xenopodis TaxID=117903 RepID=A0A3S5B8S2_9PLAT|nr:unnamed protein product [Protopolystoma xenopodis]